VKKSLLIITWSIMMQPDLQAQAQHGVENYNILNPGKEYVWVPVIHYKGNSNFYAEGRYNYEELNTGSFYLGRSFEGGKKWEYSITPMLGLVFGRYKGFSAATNTDIDYGRFNFSGQLQYTINKNDRKENFFYNWSELSYRFFEKLYGGTSIQQTVLYKGRMSTEAGLLLGYSSGKITVPVYLFNPFKNNRNLVVGLIVEWE
jgi:hypothetical protein